MIYFKIIVAAALCLLITCIILLFTNPKSSFLAFILDWEYRALLYLRSMYLSGKRCNPPTGFDFFVSRVEEYVNSKGKPYTVRQDLVNMMSREEFVDNYFNDDVPFDGKAYYQMRQDYRTGDYLTKSYDSEKELLRNLPVEIAASNEAYNLFICFVREGWFDERSGMFTDKVNKQHIGRAIYWICKKSGITNPAKVFSKLWNIPDSTIKDWYRINKSNETITEDIDKIVDAIIKKHQ